jgi:hypothetical protein
MQPKFEAIRTKCAEKEHGTRARYVGDCKCLRCRAANSTYEVERDKQRRAGMTNHVVPSNAARAHLLKLSNIGIGRRTVAQASGVSATILHSIRQGNRPNIREDTERRILAVAVTCHADHALVDAAPSWRLLNELIDDGYSRKLLALWLGAKTPALQIRKDYITAANAHKVQRLYNQIRAGKLRRPTAVKLRKGV